MAASLEKRLRDLSPFAGRLQEQIHDLAHGAASPGRPRNEVGGFPRFVEARWLVYPVLLVGAVKLLLEDVPAGRAATLVLSFALYGAALIVAPKLAKRPQPR